MVNRLFALALCWLARHQQWQHPGARFTLRHAYPRQLAVLLFARAFAGLSALDALACHPYFPDGAPKCSNQRSKVQEQGVLKDLSVIEWAHGFSLPGTDSSIGQ